MGTSLFQNYNITFDEMNLKIGFDGNVTVVNLIDGTFFRVTSYLMLTTVVVLLMGSAFLFWFIRMDKKKEISRFAEISLSTRFIDTS